MKKDKQRTLKQKFFDQRTDEIEEILFHSRKKLLRPEIRTMVEYWSTRNDLR